MCIQIELETKRASLQYREEWVDREPVFAQEVEDLGESRLAGEEWRSELLHERDGPIPPAQSRRRSSQNGC